ncbi:MAG: GntR family transcriptional regulator [Actinomycetota bacterium]
MQRLGDRHRPLRDQVADAIRDMILHGELQPGERLQEVRLAEVLGVSRNPVREAIRALEVTGLVEVQPRAGASVATFDRDDLIQLLELRAVLESWAAEQAAANHTADDLARIDRHLEGGRAASMAGDAVAASEHHNNLHLAVEQATGNRHLVGTVDPLRRKTELVFSIVSPRRPHDSWDEHTETRNAIAEGDGERAGRSARSHIDHVIAELRTVG